MCEYRPDSLIALFVLDAWRAPGPVFIWTAVWWDGILICGYWSLPLLLFSLSSIPTTLAFFFLPCLLPLPLSSGCSYPAQECTLSLGKYWHWDFTSHGNTNWAVSKSHLTDHSQMPGGMATSSTWRRVRTSFWRLTESLGAGSALCKSDDHCWSLPAAGPQHLRFTEALKSGDFQEASADSVEPVSL